jgi:hypothetical protein
MRFGIASSRNQLGQGLRRRKNRDIFVRAKHKQITVSRNDEINPSRNGQRQHCPQAAAVPRETLLSLR